jgi:hypothetical protein
MVRPEISCSTAGCWGDPFYAAPGRGHVEGCTYPVPPLIPSNIVLGEN